MNPGKVVLTLLGLLCLVPAVMMYVNYPIPEPSHTNDYYEVTKRPRDGCISFTEKVIPQPSANDLGVRVRLFGRRRWFQVGAEITRRRAFCWLDVGKRFRLEPLQYAEHTGSFAPTEPVVASPDLDPESSLIPVRALTPYGIMGHGAPRFRYDPAIAFGTIVGVGLTLIIVGLMPTSAAVGIFSRALLIILVGVVIVFPNGLLADPLAIAYHDGRLQLQPAVLVLGVPLLLGILVLLALPLSTRLNLGVGVIEAMSQVYFSMQGAEALEARRQTREARRQERMADEEARKLDDRARELDEREAALKARLATLDGSDVDYFERSFRELLRTTRDAQDYQGLIASWERRFIERQLRKNAQASEARIAAFRSLANELMAVLQQKIALDNLLVDFNRRKINIDRRIEKEDLTHETDILKLTRQRDKLRGKATDDLVSRILQTADPVRRDNAIQQLTERGIPKEQAIILVDNALRRERNPG